MDLPMPQPTNSPRPLHEYEALSFDVYGSLIEYKAHILSAFKPLLNRLPASSPYLDSTPASATVANSASKGSIEFLKVFQKQEDTIKLEKPVKRFDEILAEIWRRIAKQLDVETSEEDAKAFGSEAMIASWPCFQGTNEALKKLSRHYRLIALSNIDKYAWEITSHSATSGLGDVDWWKVFTAEDFGDDAERADEAKLETMLNFCASDGVKKEGILHVAQSLGHDQAPAKRLGISSVWLIGDGPVWGKEAESKMALEKDLVGYAFRCRNLQEFAQLVEKS
jgi:FMN phosphatase YigB (HAD superfamily)